MKTKYVASDNSFIKNISGGEYISLAGDFYEDPKEAVVVSEPYFEDGYEFINVSYNGNILRVLFDIKNINRSLKDAIRSNNEKFRFYDNLGLF